MSNCRARSAEAAGCNWTRFGHLVPGLVQFVSKSQPPSVPTVAGQLDIWTRWTRWRADVREATVAGSLRREARSRHAAGVRPRPWRRYGLSGQFVCQRAQRLGELLLVL